MKSVWAARLVIFLTASLAQLVFWLWVDWRNNGQIPLLVAAAGLLLSVLAAWTGGEVLERLQASGQRQQKLQQRLEQSELEIRQMRTFLGGSLRMDTELMDAPNENQVMEVTLSVISDLTGARGASFVPLDEWGQPLPAHIYGKVPPLVRKAWQEHLGSNEVRQNCRTCQQHQALPGGACPLLEGPFATPVGMVCFPMQRGGRLLGMVNLYTPDQPEIVDEQMLYLKGLLNEAALAVETLRMKERETSALKDLQLIHTRMDLPAMLTSLLEGLQQVLEVDAVQLQVRIIPGTANADMLPHQQEFQVGSSVRLDDPAVETLRSELLTLPYPVLLPQVDEPVRLAGVPLVLPEGRVLGVLLMGSETPFVISGRRLAILQSVADQAALLIENDRLARSIEYRTVIRERTRLAREIHDGLAQTLAFLKLQASQMQGYLAQGNLNRLSQVLKQNYETLADAYVEARQAIDHLRLDPKPGLAIWLEQLLAEFETTSGLKVERVYQVTREDILPEVQAQMVRILQEALNNIRKHAQASNVWVIVKNWNGDLLLEVRDNGQGFLPEEVPNLAQYGLRGMRERAELIGADFQVISKPQQGTRIILSIPLHPEETLV